MTVYCPAGSQAPTPVATGFFSAPAVGVATNATNVMARVEECPPGSYCVAGERLACPPGTYQEGTRRTAVSFCLVCTAGGYCPSGAASPLPCGNNTVYCPTGAAVPLLAGAGNYTLGIVGSRSSTSACSPGYFCPGDGRAYVCPAGRYGSEAGLTSANCTGPCADGVLCPTQTESASGQPCPLGQYCLAGLAVPCPKGTYNSVTGAANVSQCLLCPAGTFNAGTGSSSDAECLRCPEYEGSNPGAAACWPGILGSGVPRFAQPPHVALTCTPRLPLRAFAS